MFTLLQENKIILFKNQKKNNHIYKMDNYIEFTHSNKSWDKGRVRDSFSKPIDLKTLKEAVTKNNFSGLAVAYEKGQITWKANVCDGKFNGKVIKYIPFIPKTFIGTASGYISGWRQPVFIAKYKMDLLDGPLFMYRQDGSKHFVFNYNMGLLDGEQKHYVDYSKFVHIYERGTWLDTEKVAKSWLWSDNSDSEASLKEIKRIHEMNKNL